MKTPPSIGAPSFPPTKGVTFHGENPCSVPYTEDLRKLVGHRKVIIPGVMAILTDEKQRVLLQSRSDLKIWGLPGGAVELGENVMAALRREVLEETNLIVADAELFGLYTDPAYDVRYPNGDKLQNFVVVFYVVKYSGALRADGSESREVAFFARSAFPLLLAWHSEMLEDFFRNEAMLQRGRVIVK